MVTSYYIIFLILNFFIFCLIVSFLVSETTIYTLLFVLLFFMSNIINLMIIGFDYIGLVYLIVYLGAVLTLFLFVVILMERQLGSNIFSNKLYKTLHFKIVKVFNSCLLNILSICVIILIISSNFFFPNILYSGSYILYNFLFLESINQLTLICFNLNFFDFNKYYCFFNVFINNYYTIESIGFILYFYFYVLLVLASIILILGMVGSISITQFVYNNSNNNNISYKNFLVMPFNIKNIKQIISSFYFTGENITYSSQQLRYKISNQSLFVKLVSLSLFAMDTYFFFILSFTTILITIKYCSISYAAYTHYQDPDLFKRKLDNIKSVLKKIVFYFKICVKYLFVFTLFVCFILVFLNFDFICLFIQYFEFIKFFEDLKPFLINYWNILESLFFDIVVLSFQHICKFLIYYAEVFCMYFFNESIIKFLNENNYYLYNEMWDMQEFIEMHYQAAINSPLSKIPFEVITETSFKFENPQYSIFDNSFSNNISMFKLYFNEILNSVFAGEKESYDKTKGLLHYYSIVGGDNSIEYLPDPVIHSDIKSYHRQRIKSNGNIFERIALFFEISGINNDNNKDTNKQETKKIIIDLSGIDPNSPPPFEESKHEFETFYSHQVAPMLNVIQRDCSTVFTHKPGEPVPNLPPRNHFGQPQHYVESETDYHFYGPMEHEFQSMTLPYTIEYNEEMQEEYFQQGLPKNVLEYIEKNIDKRKDHVLHQKFDCRYWKDTLFPETLDVFVQSYDFSAYEHEIFKSKKDSGIFKQEYFILYPKSKIDSLIANEELYEYITSDQWIIDKNVHILDNSCKFFIRNYDQDRPYHFVEVPLRGDEFYNFVNTYSDFLQRARSDMYTKAFESYVKDVIIWICYLHLKTKSGRGFYVLIPCEHETDLSFLPREMVKNPEINKEFWDIVTLESPSDKFVLQHNLWMYDHRLFRPEWKLAITFPIFEHPLTYKNIGSGCHDYLILKPSDPMFKTFVKTWRGLSWMMDDFEDQDLLTRLFLKHKRSFIADLKQMYGEKYVNKLSYDFLFELFKERVHCMTTPIKQQLIPNTSFHIRYNPVHTVVQYIPNECNIENDYWTGERYIEPSEVIILHLLNDNDAYTLAYHYGVIDKDKKIQPHVGVGVSPFSMDPTIFYFSHFYKFMLNYGLFHDFFPETEPTARHMGVFWCSYEMTPFFDSFLYLRGFWYNSTVYQSYTTYKRAIWIQFYHEFIVYHFFWSYIVLWNELFYPYFYWFRSTDALIWHHTKTFVMSYLITDFLAYQVGRRGFGYLHVWRCYMVPYGIPFLKRNSFEITMTLVRIFKLFNGRGY